MVQFWLTSKTIQDWRRKELEKLRQILCTLNFVWFFWARHKLRASSLPVQFSDDFHFSLLKVIVFYWHILTKAIKDSEPPRGGKHHTKDLLYFYIWLFCWTFQVAPSLKNFTENEECFLLSILVAALKDLVLLSSKDLTQTSQWYLWILLPQSKL